MAAAGGSVNPALALVPLVSGGMAGFAVDVSLYPIDTVKTRLQSPLGFFGSGGFRGMYRGISAAAAGSVPGAALFFGVYESMKKTLKGMEVSATGSHMLAASTGEIAACCVRVPVEVVKQRLQAGQYSSLRSGVFQILSTDGIAGFFRGYGMTILREIPFAAIQMPLLEIAKDAWRSRRKGQELLPIHVAACGSLCGGLAAAATTPLDVIKTRLMLGSDKLGVAYDSGILNCAQRILSHEGPSAFFAGLSARVFWISLGGFVFFGAYDASTTLLSKAIDTRGT